MKKWGLSIALVVIYLSTMILPYYLTTTDVIEATNYWIKLHYGALHYPSVVYIVLAAIILHRSIGADAQASLASHKALHQEIEEASQELDIESIKYNEIAHSNNSFVRKIIAIIKNGGIEDDLELVVQKETLALITRYEKLIAEYSYIAAILPMLGMLGTITGLLQMFAVPDGMDDIAQKMAGLSVALATTLYATLWVVLITKPKSREIESKLIELSEEEYALIMDAKLFLHNVDINMLVSAQNDDEIVFDEDEDEEHEDDEASK